MSGKIPQSFIDELLTRVDIVDLIDARVPLKKTGVNYSARCPFHNEKTPSFTVSRDKQFYHCFGCGAHGTAIGFLMEHDRLGFIEAVEELAARCGLSIPRDAAVPAEAPGHGIYELQQQVAGYYAEQLRRHPQRERAVAYLKQRGVSGEVAAHYGLGYAPPGWDNLKGRFGEQSLLDAGLLVDREDGKRYDRFRDRIMFPIRDRRGRVVGFGGRVLDSGEPKYLNSPETAVFKKRREVYGLYELLKTPGKPPFILVVEGYMDVVALAQYGIPYAVATLGTATTPEHMELLFRYCAEVVFCFDGDAAGHAAGWRAMEAALPHMRDGRQVRFLHVPQGHDPDTLVRAEGAEGFKARITSATALSDYFFERLQSGLNLTEMEGRAGLVTRGRELLGKLPDGVFRQMMLASLAQQGGVARVELAAKPAAPPLSQGARRRLPQRRLAPSLVRRISEMVLAKPGLAVAVDRSLLDWLAASGDNECAFLQQLLEIAADNPHIQSAAAVERFRDTPYWEYAQSLLGDERPDGLLAEGMDVEFSDALNGLHDKMRAQRVDALVAKMDGGLSAEEAAEYQSLMAGNRVR